MRVMPLFLLLLAACTAVVPDAPTNTPSPQVQPSATIAPTALPSATAVVAETAVAADSAIVPATAAPEIRINRRVETDENYVPYGLLPFDGILPVYQPQFAAAVDAPLQDDELVLGVAWDGEAKAYPISVLRFREIVNDELAGIPTLVTW